MIRELLCEATISFWLSVLAGDILYFYYAGAWTDTSWIRVTELCFLWFFVVAGIVNTIRCAILIIKG